MANTKAITRADLVKEGLAKEAETRRLKRVRAEWEHWFDNLTPADLGLPEEPQDQQESY